MNLGDRTSQRHTAIVKTAVVSSDYWDFAPGQRVMTREGFAGVVNAVSDGPYPGAEEYEVTLDAGLGGGSYAPGELRPLDPPLAAEAADQGAIRQQRKSRQTGTTVLVIDGQHPDSDVPGTPEEGGRWVTVCDEHGGSCNHLTLEDAKGWAADPQAWCWGCQEMRDQGHTEASLEATALVISPGHPTARCITCGHYQDPSYEQAYLGEVEDKSNCTCNSPDCACYRAENDTSGLTWKQLRERKSASETRTAADDYPELGNILEERPDHEHAIPVSASLQTTAGERGKTTLWSVDKASYEASSYEGEYRGTMVRFERVTDDTDRDRFGNRLSSPVTQWYGYVASGMDGLKPRWSVVAESEPSRKAAIETVERHIDGMLRSEGRKLIPITDESPRPGFDVEASWFSDHATDYLTRHTPTEFRTDPEHAHSVDWCRFRRNSRCFFSHTLDEAATQQAGYVVWTPEDRGFCPRITWDAQRECPIGEPGPNSGAPNAGVEATVPWEQGGQRYGALQAEAFQAEGRWHLTATWRDVRAKAKRIRSEGGVRIIAAPTQTDTSVVAEVRGDHNIYETTITREPGKHAVAMWTCGCAWASYSWGRSGRWKRYEGRMCSHALALTYEVQAKGMFGKTILEDREQPAWRMDPTIPVIQPQNYPKPKRRRASLDRGDAVVIMRHPRYNDAYSAHVEHDGKVWSFDCGHLHHTPEAAKKCIPKVETDWKAWRDAPRKELGFNDVVEMTKALDRPGAVQYRRISPETDAIRHEGSLRPLETDKALEIAPAVLIAQGMLSQGYSPNETLDTLVDMGLPNAPGIITQAMAVKPFKAKVRGWVRKVVELLPGGHARLETGEEVPLSQVYYPTYDPRLGLDPSLRDSVPHIATAEHRWSVMQYRGYSGQRTRTTWGANCSCGWRGKTRSSPERARQDGTEHEGSVENTHEAQGADTKGVMICFRVPDKLAHTLAELGTEDVSNIHITLAYFGKPDEIDPDQLRAAVRSFADTAPTLLAEVSGLGTFENGEENVLVATWDIPGIDRFRSDLVTHCEGFGQIPYSNHGFTPHATLSYGDKPFRTLPKLPDGVKERFAISDIWLTIGDEWEHFPLTPLGATTADLTSDWAEALTEGYESGDVDADAVTWFAPSEAGQALGEQGAFVAELHEAVSNKPDWCKVCGTSIHEIATRKWRHQRPMPNGDPWDHAPEPGGTKSDDPWGHAGRDALDRRLKPPEAELHDESEPALPETDGADEDEDAIKPGDAKLGWLMSGGGKDQSNSEIAAMARQYLKEGAKAFTPAEQRQIIDEGEGVLAANFDALDITGTHYMALEEALQKEDDEEDVAWLA